jgi:hypothetical protein
MGDRDTENNARSVLMSLLMALILFGGMMYALWLFSQKDES